MPDDERWLRHAFTLAARAVAAGDYAFGAALVGADGAVLAEAEQTLVRTGDWLAHAELVVLREASSTWTREQLAGATLYSSTEPCPMCTGAIGWSVNRLVFGLSQAAMYRIFRDEQDPPRFTRPWNCRTVLDHLSPPMEVVGPLLESEAAAIHRTWPGSKPASQVANEGRDCSRPS